MTEEEKARIALERARIFAGYLMQYADDFESHESNLDEFLSYIGYVSYLLDRTAENLKTGETSMLVRN